MRRAVPSGIALLAFLSCGALGAEPGISAVAESVSADTLRCIDSALRIEFDAAAMKSLGWEWTARGDFGEAVNILNPVFGAEPGAMLAIGIARDNYGLATGGAVRTRGGLLLSHQGERRFAIGGLVLELEEPEGWTVYSTIGFPGEKLSVFQLPTVLVDAQPLAGRLRIDAELAIHPDWAFELGHPEWSGTVIGVLRLEGALRGPEDEERARATGTALPPLPLAATVGPDVIVGDLQDTNSYGTGNFGSISAFSLGTVSCNVGDEPVSWYSNTNQHPVIAQNLYRLKEGRFEQIGMSWLKHGFLAVTGNNCLLGCTPPPGGGNQLGVGCSDPYSASLNGQQSNLGPRSHVNAHTGHFPYPFSAPSYELIIGRRLQVLNVDIDPALNAGALYFAEGHYVTPDDAAAGNQNNNASYRRATIAPDGTGYSLGLTGIIRRRRAALRAWREYDSTVFETDIQVPDDGLFILGAKVTDLGNGFWHYEYALQNLNSDRAGGLFRVPVDPGATVINIGFRAPFYHSGEPYDGSDWAGGVAGDAVIWSTGSFISNPNANALRWSTTYNFRFDADVPPSTLPVTIELFKPGTPTEVTGLSYAPATPPPACGNAVIEAGEQCDPPDNVLCDAACQTIVNNPHRGGLLWDRWWSVVGSPAPTGNHPLYPPVGQQAGSATFRCKECHGWDYKGVDGAYGTGSHYTGIPGVFGSTRTAAELFDIIRNDTPPHGHGFASYGLIDQDVRDLVQFITEMTLNTDTFIDANGQFLGNPTQGQSFYTSGASPSCVLCHGADGTNINFGSTLNPEWVGTVAVQNPWEFLHKIRFGSAGSPMPSWLAGGGSDQGAADIGRYAQLSLPAVCQSHDMCDDGKFCNGEEACDSGSCVAGSVPCPAQPCDEGTDQCGVADAHRGGLLYDQWWDVLEIAAPTGTHPLYPPGGQQSGSDTFRCVECHGWDYKGADGAYASGPHSTGIGGVFGSALTAEDMFLLIRDAVPPNGHGFGALGLSENDIWDLVAFVQDLAIDTDSYIDAGGAFQGSEVQGQVAYETGGSIACLVCHGPDGTDLNFGTPSDPTWVGTVAWNDPWRLLHKIRLGNPTGPMPSWLLGGGTDQGAADIGRYAQLEFPVDCVNQGQCDDGLFCTGVEFCQDGFCQAGPDPCPGQVCDETLPGCLSGLCPEPSVTAEGSRHLRVTPAVSANDVALMVFGDPMVPGLSCLQAYVQADGTLGAAPFFQSAIQWSAVSLGDEAVVPNATYRVRTDCGTPGEPDLSLAIAAQTWQWGDVDHNQVINFADIQLLIKAFQGDFTLVTVDRADMEPCLPNRVINFSDIQQGVRAFQGIGFSGMACPITCP